MYNLFYIEIYSATVSFPALLVVIEFFYFFQTGQRLWRWGAALVEIIVLVIPVTLLMKVDSGDSLGNDTIIFPAVRVYVYLLILLCQVAYFYSAWRQRLAAPLKELFINCSLLLGVVINILLVIRMQDLPALLAINLPATLLLILALVRNHRLLLYTLENMDADFPEPAPRGRFSKACWYLLQMKPVVKICLFTALPLPAVVWLTKIML